MLICLVLNSREPKDTCVQVGTESKFASIVKVEYVCICIVSTYSVATFNHYVLSIRLSVGLSVHITVCFSENYTHFVNLQMLILTWIEFYSLVYSIKRADNHDVDLVENTADKLAQHLT